jgi:hypothetical protein
MLRQDGFDPASGLAIPVWCSQVNPVLSLKLLTGASRAGTFLGQSTFSLIYYGEDKNA